MTEQDRKKLLWDWEHQTKERWQRIEKFQGSLWWLESDGGMLHGYNNKLIMVAKLKKQNPEGTGITEKRIRKGNVECKRDSIIWWRSVTTDEERYTQRKVGQKELKKILSKRKKRNKQGPTEELQSEIPKQYGEDNFGWLQRDTDPKKISSIFALQEQTM